jgi:hypothetical protein
MRLHIFSSTSDGSHVIYCHKGESRYGVLFYCANFTVADVVDGSSATRFSANLSRKEY